MISLQTGAALFLAGIASGIALHRFLMAVVLEQSPDTLCAYRKWLKAGKQNYDSD